MQTNQLKTSPIQIWLYASCICVILMVFIGGVTRLSEAGLSITSWKPITGIIPPLSEADWQQEFTAYQQIPEYKIKNLGMQLSEFKYIFWLEFIHRLFGRITGIVFFVPFFYFLLQKQLSKTTIKHVATVALLGATQGFVGWFMVKSGLKDRTDVSQYWLTFHLLMAFSIYGILFYSAISFNKINKAISSKKIDNPNKALIYISYFIMFLLILQVALGGFTAGTDAGLIYNSFPDMNGSFIPDGLLVLTPWYLNFFENTTMIQFMHRYNAYFLALNVFIFYFVSTKFALHPLIKRAIALLCIVTIVQICLGAATLLTHVNIATASIHQIFALVLYSYLIFIIYRLKQI